MLTKRTYKCEHLSARNYHDVVCERAEAVRICGYPLCPKSITAVTTSKFIVKAGEKRIVKNEVLKMYCSEICMVRSMWIHRQLEEGHRKIQILGNNSAGESVVRNVITHHVDRMLASFSQSTTVNVLVSEREDPNPAENHPQYRNADNADAFRVDGYEYDKSMPLSLDQRLKDLSINPSLPLPRSNLDSPSSTSTSADGPKDIGKSAQTKGSDSENSSEDESEAEISEPDSDDEDPPVSISDFLIPSQRSKPEDLSVFGSLWSFLSRTVTPSTEKCLRLMDFDDAVNPNMLENEETRQRIFSQNFGTAFNALVRSSTPLERDLASLISSMHFSHPKYALLDRQHMERLVVILVGLLDATLAKTLEVVVDASWGSEWTILRRVFHEDSNI